MTKAVHKMSIHHWNIFQTLFHLLILHQEMSIHMYFAKFRVFHLFDFGNFSLKKKKENII